MSHSATLIRASRAPGKRERWRQYLEQFHHDRPGITTDTLGTARFRGTDPYQWALEPLRTPAWVVDIACGDAPIFLRSPKPGWIGLDASRAELRRARQNAAGPLVQADAARLPLASGSVPAVVCSMALMVVQPLDTALSEVRRVLTDDGLAVALIPGGWPLTARDLYRYARLMAALGRTHLAYPNDWRLTRLRACAARANLQVVDDRRRRFELPLDSEAAANRFVASLYLPDIQPRRLRAAEAAVTRWVPGGIGIPLRRITFKPT